MGQDPAGAYGTGVRKQVFEVIVRQALVGAPWQQSCRALMAANVISEEEIEQELTRRKRLSFSPEKTPEESPKEAQEKHIQTARKDYSQFQAAVDAALDQIPHSQVSPCACKKCRSLVSAILKNTAVEVQKTLHPLANPYS
jgi:hypothetical protein